MDRTAGTILKYSFFYFGFSLLISLVVDALRSLTEYTFRVNFALSPYEELINTAFMLLAWILWTVLMFVLTYDEAYEEFATEHKLGFQVQGALIIATGLFILASSTQAGNLLPRGLFIYPFYPHCVLAYAIGDCFYSCIVMATLSLGILLFARALGKISFLNNYPSFAYARRLEKQRLKEERRRYYSVDDE